MSSVELTIPWPPSVNMMWRTVGGRTLLSAEGREYRKRVRAAVFVAGFPQIEGRLSVEIAAYPPDKRRRDLDNLPKGILDALQDAEVYEDDSQIDRLLIVRGPVHKGGRVDVAIEGME